MPLHVDEVNINYSCVSKIFLPGSSCNDATKLANSVLTFLLSNINSYYKHANIGAIPTNFLDDLFLE